MRPSNLLLIVIIAWGLIGVAASVTPSLAFGWQVAGALLGIVSLLDMLVLAAQKPVKVTRKIPSRFAVDVPGEISLTLENPTGLSAPLTVFDGVPPDSEFQELPQTTTVPAKASSELIYSIKILKRGNPTFQPAHILRASSLRLWKLAFRAGTTDSVRIYPNYEPVIRYSLLAISDLNNSMGIRFRNRQGISRDFHQLREYQEGDVLSQIDWKASSRRLELISREYREQRDQNIIVMVDSGRRMRAMDGHLPQFDHCLNAVLLMSFIALRQGDNVGVLSFGGTNRWLPPVKGEHSMTTILNHLYDYETSASPSDFSEAAERLLTRQRRRALVIVLTNLRGEDSGDLIPALRTIQRKHLVMLASLREKTVQSAISTPVESFEQALKYGATGLYLEERQRVFEELNGHGILTLDETAPELPAALTNAYLDVKNSGRL